MSNTLTVVSIEYAGSRASMEEDLPWLHHVVTDTLAGQEALNGDTCILDKSLDFPHRAIHHRGLQTSTNAVCYRRLRKSSVLGRGSV